jgi:hypothetical protein
MTRRRRDRRRATRLNLAIQLLQTVLRDSGRRVAQLKQVPDAGQIRAHRLLSGSLQHSQFTNQLLYYEIELNQTIICVLEKISKHTCELVNLSPWS